MNLSTKTARDFLMKIQKTRNSKMAALGLVDPVLEDRKNVLDLNIAVGVDVSGSISSAQFGQFMNQLKAIKGLSRVKVIETDTRIVAMYDYFSVEPKRIVRNSGGGGTEFTPAFKLFKELKPDAILFMTDGDAAGNVQDPHIPVGWILTRGGHPPFNFGSVVVKLP